MFPNIQADPLTGHIDSKGSTIQHCLTAPCPETLWLWNAPWSVCMSHLRYGRAYSALLSLGWRLLNLEPLKNQRRSVSTYDR